MAYSRVIATKNGPENSSCTYIKKQRVYCLVMGYHIGVQGVDSTAKYK